MLSFCLNPDFTDKLVMENSDEILEGTIESPGCKGHLRVLHERRDLSGINDLVHVYYLSGTSSVLYLVIPPDSDIYAQLRVHPASLHL